MRKKNEEKTRIKKLAKRREKKPPEDPGRIFFDSLFFVVC